MKKLLTLLLLLSFLGAAAQASDQCIYGLYIQDSGELIIENESESYLESIKADYITEYDNVIIEISQCEGRGCYECY